MIVLRRARVVYRVIVVVNARVNVGFLGNRRDQTGSRGTYGDADQRQRKDKMS